MQWRRGVDVGMVEATLGSGGGSARAAAGGSRAAAAAAE